MNISDLNISEIVDKAKDTLGLEPQEAEDGAYTPSKASLKLAAPNKTNYDHSEYEAPYRGNKKILMVCTERQYMTMANDKKFKTGNHPVEMMVPLLHFKKAGFTVDVFTPTGEAVKVEQWAMPEDDDDVKKIYAEYESKLNSPKSIADFVKNDMEIARITQQSLSPVGMGQCWACLKIITLASCYVGVMTRIYLP